MQIITSTLKNSIFVALLWQNIYILEGIFELTLLKKKQYLECVFGSIAWPPDANRFQHSCVSQLLNHQGFIQIHLFLLINSYTTEIFSDTLIICKLSMFTSQTSVIFFKCTLHCKVLPSQHWSEYNEWSKALLCLEFPRVWSEMSEGNKDMDWLNVRKMPVGFWV